MATRVQSNTAMSLFSSAPSTSPGSPCLAITSTSSSARLYLHHAAKRSPCSISHAACTHNIRSSSLTSTPSPSEAIRPPSCSSAMRLPTPTDLITLKMPSICCTFPTLIHTDYEVVKDACDAWIDAVAEPPSPSASRFLRHCLIPLLGCRFMPKATSQRRLVHIVKVIAWLVIVDDYDDHPDALGSDRATTSHRAELVMAILRKKANADNIDATSLDCSFFASARPGFAGKSTRILKALAELWDEICEEMSPSLQARFISSMVDYFEGLKIQALFREKATIPNVDSYIKIRRKAGITIPNFVLMEYALDIELDEATYYNPLIEELRIVANDYISFCNDIYSCPTEINMGDYFNLPSILYNSESPSKNLISFQTKMDHAAQMVEDLNKRAMFLISTIHEESKNFEPHMVSAIHAYVDGLTLCMSGAIPWYCETARYQQVNGRRELHELP